MGIITTKDVTEYLRQVVALEGSIYRQEQAIISANKNLKLKLPEKKKIPMPIDESKKIEKPNYEKINDGLFPMSGCAKYAVLFTIAPLLWGIVFETVWAVWAGAIIGILSIIGLAYCSVSNKKQEKENAVRFDTEMEEYNKNVSQARAEYEEAMRVYQIQARNIAENHKTGCERAQKGFSIAQEAVQQMNCTLAETKALLQKLYDLNLIFPKYRNLVAMSTIYEYYASGRCSQLEGPDGAYNLYESELRQNLVINQLEGIANKLDQIQQNQYTLYTEIHNIGEIMKGISKDVNAIMVNTCSIAQCSYITALNTKVIADNTEAIKYISLINS